MTVFSYVPRERFENRSLSIAKNVPSGRAETAAKARAIAASRPTPAVCRCSKLQGCPGKSFNGTRSASLLPRHPASLRRALGCPDRIVALAAKFPAIRGIPNAGRGALLLQVDSPAVSLGNTSRAGSELDGES